MRSIDDYIRDLKTGRSFSSVKVNHGLWERILKIEEALAQGVQDAAELDRLSGSTPHLAETGFLVELLALFRRLPRISEDFDFATSVLAWPYCHEIAVVPASGLTKTEATIKRHVPEGWADREDGLLWKRAVINGDFVRFVDALRERHIVLVGPDWLSGFGTFANLPRFRHVAIHSTAARAGRRDLMRRLIAEHRPEDAPVYLFQAGSLATWLIFRLHGRLENATLIDVGLPLDLCAPVQVLRSKQWTQAYRRAVTKTILDIAPDWISRPEANDGSEPADRAWREFSHGVDSRIADIAGVAPRSDGGEDLDFPDLGLAKIDFVEPKRTNWSRVHDFLAMSQSSNHWTNFGPVSLALERSLETVFGVPSDRAVVMASSGTAALVALAGVHAVKKGRPLRWVGSSFGFFASYVGPLSEDVTLVDCDDRGFLDLDAVAAMPDDSWDGLLVTNLFGFDPNLDRYRAFCRERGKALIADNATALYGFDRSRSDSPDEIVSFHHTKPWGVGEGGCAILSRDDADLFRKLLNFGVGAPNTGLRYAANGKISDFACALILERLERSPAWTNFYDMQARRIAAACRLAGLTLLPDAVPPGKRYPTVAASVAAVSSDAISREAIDRSGLPLRKYYPPLSPDAPRAADLYSRIVNVPCHPGMAALPLDVVASRLETLTSERSARKPHKPATSANPACAAQERGRAKSTQDQGRSLFAKARRFFAKI